MSVVSYLDCGCAILSDGGREWCPTCAAKIEGTNPEPQPLDDKELREKLDKVREHISAGRYNNFHSYDVYLTEGQKKQILALLQPKIAEKCTVAFDTGLSMGKRQERERIVEIYIRYHDVIAPLDLKKIMLEEQALSSKGGENK